MASAVRAAFSDLRLVSAEAIITISGIVSTLLVVGANQVVATSTGIDILSYSIWLIVPAGAMLGGAAAASGYYAAARVTQTMPSKTLGWSMVAIGASAWLLSIWLGYFTLRLGDGTMVRDVVGFLKYFVFRTEHMSLTVSARPGLKGVDTGELGSWGYVREAAQLLGFLLGGFAIWATLGDVDRCDSCRKYCKSQVLLRRVSADDFDSTLSQAAVEFPGLVEYANAAIGKKQVLGFNLYALECPSCHARWATPAIVVRSGRDAAVVKVRRYQADEALIARLTQAADAVQDAGKKKWWNA